MPAYALVAAKSGFKLKPTADDGRGSWISGPGKLKAQRTSLDAFARYLSGILRSPTADATGIKGVFDLTLEWSLDEAAPSSGPSIFTALQEQLELKLETQEEPAQVIVIDRIEKPTENQLLLRLANERRLTCGLLRSVRLVRRVRRIAP